MKRTTLVSIAVLAIVAQIASSAGAAPAEADLRVDIGVITALIPGRPLPPTVPNGGTATVTSRNFLAGPAVRTSQPASATVRFELSDGLRWSKEYAGQNCTRTSTTAECTTPLLTPGQFIGEEDHWGWDIVAARVGRYTLRAQIVKTSTPDPVLSNNSATVTVVVTDAVASGVRVTPAKPKAGTAVAATVFVIAGGGAPIRPTGIACAGAIGAAKLKGTPTASSGSATCVYRTPETAKGKTLRGTISFSARGTKFTKRFSTRLG